MSRYTALAFSACFLGATVHASAPSPGAPASATTARHVGSGSTAKRVRHLAGAYGGYFIDSRPKVSPDKVRNIKLVLDDDFLANADASFAAEIAGTEWSASGAVSILLDNTGPEIHVHFSDDPRQEDPGCDGSEEVLGCGLFPSDGNPGTDIWLARDAGRCPWTSQLYLNTIAHELGHTLGFTHPEDPGSTQIPGTAGGFLLYYTVMIPAPVFESPDSCVLQQPWLSDDDILSVQTVYGGN